MTGRLLSVLFTLFSLLLPFQASTAGVGDRGIRKIVIDNTITYPGHEFYRAFTHFLSLETGSMYYDQVALTESKHRSGARILIIHHEKILYRTNVYIADRNLDKKAKHAAKIVARIIGKEELSALFSRPGDLAGDEL